MQNQRPIIAIEKLCAKKGLGILLLALALSCPAHASSYTWNGSNSGLWEDPNDWNAPQPPSPYTGAAGDVVIFGSGAATGNVGVAATDTVGIINVGGTGINYNIGFGGDGGTLILNNSGAGAQINELTGALGDSVTAPISISDTNATAALTITNSSTSTFTVSGGITSSGTGQNLVLAANGSGAIIINNASTSPVGTAVNNGGALTNSGTGTNNVTISGGIGSSVTTINQNAATSTLTLTTGAASTLPTIAVNSGGTTINSNGAAIIISSGGAAIADVSGTGNLTINANSTGSITVSTGTVNNTGTVTNSGSGTGTVTISSAIGASVTGVTQNSSGSSVLSLTAATNTFTGNVSVLGGTLLFANAADLGTASNAVLLGNTSGSLNAALETTTNTFTWTRNITVQSGNTGAATIGSVTSGAYTVAGTITLGTASSAGHGVSLLAATTGTENISATISDPSGLTAGTAGAVTVTSSGAIVELSGANTFSGGVNLAAGNLSINNASALGTGTFTISGGNISQVASQTSSTNNNALVLNQDFSYTGNGFSLNLGNGAASLGALTTGSTGTTSVNAARTITVNSGGTLTIGGVISNGTNGVTKGLTVAGTGTLILNGNNAYTGGTTVNGGILQLGGTQASTVTLNAGGSLNATGLFSTVTGWLGSGDISTASIGDIALTGNSSENINFGSYSSLMLGASSNATYTGALTPSGTTYHLGGGGATLTLSAQNTLTGGNSLVVGAVTLLGPTAGTSVGTVQLTNSDSMSGTTSVNAGTLNLSASSGNTFGALPNSAITVTSSTLTIDSNGATVIPSSVTRAASVMLNGSTMTVTGNASGNTNDAITGTLTLQGGANIINITPVTASAEFSAATLAQGANGGYALVSGSLLGRAAVGTAGDTNIKFTTAPTVVGTTQGSALATNDATANLVIVPYLVGTVSATANAGGVLSANANTFLTYDSTFGLRPLDLTNEFTNNAITAGNNTRITLATTSSAAGTTSINSLVMASNTLTITDGTTLRDTSGALLFANTTGTTTIKPSTSSGVLDFNTAQGVITVDNGGTGSISAVVTGSNGLVKLGAGGLTLSGANTYTGTTELLAGVLSVGGSNTNNLGADTSAILLGDTSGANNVTFINSGSSSLARNFVVQGGNTGTATLSSGGADTYSGNIVLGSTVGGTVLGHNLTLNGGGNFNATTFTGTISDPLGLTGPAGVVNLTVGANNSLVINGNNTYTGGTIMNAGVTIGSSTAFGTGTLTVNGGSLNGNNHTIANSVILNSNLGISASSITFAGPVSLTGTRTITGGVSSFTITGVISDSVAGSNDGLGITETNASGAFTSGLYGLNTFDGGLTLNSNQSLALNFALGNFGNTSAASALGTGTFTIGPVASGGSVVVTNGTGIANTLSTNNAEVWNSDLTVGGIYFDMGTGAVSLGSSAAATRTITVNANSFETDGVISNGTNAVTPTVNLTKAGIGALVLGANEAYTGSTTISAGMLQLGNGGTTGNIAASTGASLAVPSGGNLIIDRSDSFTLGSAIIGNSGIVSGAGNFIQAGTGTLTINTVQTYTGATSITGGGTLKLDGSTGSLATTAGTISSLNSSLFAGSSSTFSVNNASLLFVVGAQVSGTPYAAGSYIVAISGNTVTLNTSPSNAAAGVTITETIPTFSGLGGTLDYDNTNSTGIKTQTLPSAIFAGGAGNIVSTWATGTDTLDISTAVFRGRGATGNFVVSGGTNGVQNSIVLTPVTTGFIDRGIFFDGGTANGSYAYRDTGATQFIRGINYGVDANTQLSPGGALFSTGATTGSGFTTTGNVEMTGAITGQTTQTISTLQMAGANNLTLANTTNTTLTLNGILKSGNNAATISTASGAGINQSISNGGSELVIYTNQASDALTISSVISGAGGLTASGSGTLVLSAANTYTGTNFLDAGELDFNNAQALGNSTSLFTINGGTLDNTSAGSITSAKNYTLSLGGDFAFGGTKALNLGTGLVVLGGNESTARTITTNGTAALTLGGDITNGTNGILPTTGLIKAGNGVLVLNGANSYTGSTVVNGGTLVATGASSTSFTSTGTVNDTSSTISGLASTANLVVGEFVTGTNVPAGSYITSINTGAGSITLNNITLHVTAASQTLTFSAYGAVGTGNIAISGGAFQLGDGTTNGSLLGTQTIADNATFAIDNNGTSQTLSNVISGTGTVNLMAGNVVLSGLNTYSGPTNIKAGSLSVSTVGSNSTAQGLGEGTSVTLGVASTSSGTLVYTGTAGTLAKNINALGNGGDTVQNTGSGLLTLTGTLTKANTTLTLNGGASGITVSGQITGGTTSDFNSDLDITGGVTTLTNSNNNYTGPTNIFAAGTLKDGVANAVPVGSVVNIGNATDGAMTNTYDLNGFNQTIAALNSTSNGGSTNSNIVVNNGATGTNTLTLSGINSDSTAANGTFGGVIQDGTAKTALTISGGTQTLSGNNTYTGGTSVVGGTLFLNNTAGSGAGTGSLTVAAGATLGGTGSYGTTGTPGASFSIAGTGTATGQRANVLVGMASAGDTNTTASLTMIASSTATITNANLTFNINAQVTGQGTELNVGNTLVAFGAGVQSTTLTLNVENTGVITGSPLYVLFAGNTTNAVDQYSGLSLGTGVGNIATGLLTPILNSGVGQSGDLTLALTGLANSWYGAHSSLFLYQNSSTGADDIEVEVVPEPGTWALMLGGLAALVFWQRARRRS